MYIKFLIVLLISLSFSACDFFVNENNLDSDTLEKNYKKFLDKNLNTYIYSIDQFCFCLPDRAGKHFVHVKNDKLTAVYDIYKEKISNINYYTTLDGLFDQLREAIDKNAYSINASFDKDNFYPTHIYIDYSDFTEDDEISYSIHLEPSSCTTQFVYGLTLNIYDIDTNKSIGCGTNVNIQRHQYNYDEDTIQNTYYEDLSSNTSECKEPILFKGLGERAGYYNINIQKSGYQELTEYIDLDRDACHVVPKHLKIGLKAL